MSFHKPPGGTRGARTEHILLGLIRDGSGVAAQVLVKLCAAGGHAQLGLVGGAAAIPEHLQSPPFGPGHLTNSLHHLAELSAPTSRARTPRS